EVTCGKGTYIRTLATDIGLKLGFPAHMSRLTRIASGGFQLESSLTIDQIKELHEHDSLHNELFPIEYGLKGLKSFQVKDSNFKKKICNGQKFHKKVLSQDVKEPFIFVDNSTQKVLAIYIVHPDKPYEIKPKKVFN
ncbi:MAG: tRNA pseudouridine(55) synthase TruB, partial [Staphylococcus epidermidis]|nr:tRNA pseudouridine(55) synthase TruB [Staphylococcus epidermidis]MDU2885385.1 tRNA pseudouridine(55) synthase TruB [Staphylococcus epidermidis]